MSGGNQSGSHWHLGVPMLVSVITPQGAESIIGELQLLARSGDYSQILRRSAQLAEQVKWSLDPKALAHDLGKAAGDSPIAAMMAIECLAEVDAPAADDHLVDLLSHSSRIVRRHLLGSRDWFSFRRNRAVRIVTDYSRFRHRPNSRFTATGHPRGADWFGHREKCLYCSLCDRDLTWLIVFDNNWNVERPIQLARLGLWNGAQ